MYNDLEYYLSFEEGDNITVTSDLLNCLEDCKEKLQALKIIKQKPEESGICINYINLNVKYPKMQNYEHYCMSIRDDKRVAKEEFEVLMKCFNY